MAIAKVGDTNRDGTCEIIDTDWDYNGTLRVTVASPWPRTKKTEAAARRLARRALMYPEDTRKSPILSVNEMLDDQHRVWIRFGVSRNER